MLREVRPIERTMVARMAAAGHEEAALRPPEVRAMAARVRAWAAAPEVCDGCRSLQAVVLRDGQALCGRCRAGMANDSPIVPASRAPRADAPDEDDATTGVQFRGMAIVFNQPSVDLGFIEEIRPSAVDRTAQEGTDVFALWNHDSSEPMGRLTAGNLRTYKTTRGLAIELDAPPWTARQLEMVKRRVVTGMSFAFEPVTDEWWLEEGIPHRAILDMRYVEVSGVAFPAYPQTSLTVVRANERVSWWQERQTADRLRLAR